MKFGIEVEIKSKVSRSGVYYFRDGKRIPLYEVPPQNLIVAGSYRKKLQTLVLKASKGELVAPHILQKVWEERNSRIPAMWTKDRKMVKLANKFSREKDFEEAQIIFEDLVQRERLRLRIRARRGPFEKKLSLIYEKFGLSPGQKSNFEDYIFGKLVDDADILTFLDKLPTKPLSYLENFTGTLEMWKEHKPEKDKNAVRQHNEHLLNYRKSEESRAMITKAIVQKMKEAKASGRNKIYEILHYTPDPDQAINRDDFVDLVFSKLDEKPRQAKIQFINAVFDPSTNPLLVFRF